MTDMRSDWLTPRGADGILCYEESWESLRCPSYPSVGYCDRRVAHDADFPCCSDGGSCLGADLGVAQRGGHLDAPPLRSVARERRRTSPDSSCRYPSAGRYTGRGVLVLHDDDLSR